MPTAIPPAPEESLLYQDEPNEAEEMVGGVGRVDYGLGEDPLSSAGPTPREQPAQEPAEEPAEEGREEPAEEPAEEGEDR